MVTHADGSNVTSTDPARPGEEVVIYAVGMGLPSGPVQTGDVSPSPAATVERPVYLQYDFRPNATPAISYFGPSANAALKPTFVGLTPGQVGLYQINVQLPSQFPQVAECGTFSPGSSTSRVNANLTITLGVAGGGSGGISGSAFTSFDGAGICVQPPQPDAE